MDVLIVDDNSLSLFVAELHINSWGIATHLSESGYLALQMIKKRNFDLIFMDIQMPGLDGIETTRLIRKQKNKHYKKVPIIALTSANQKNVISKAMDCGMTDYILKPFNPDRLRELIQKYLIVQA